MAGKKTGGTSDADWLQGAWQMAAELGEIEGQAVQVSLTPTKRKGVWRVRVRLVHVVDGRAAGISAQTDGEYPNGAAQNLTPYLMQQLHELDRIVAERIALERESAP